MASKLSAEDIEECRCIFKQFDKDGSGKIMSNELGDVLKSVGLHLTEKEVAKMLKELDSDGSGSIEFDEFIKMVSVEVASNKDLGLGSSEMRAAFKEFDGNQNGRISRDELKLAMDNVNLKCTSAQLDRMMKDADANDDGSVDYEEFIKLFNAD